jgi:hypothetical protein
MPRKRGVELDNDRHGLSTTPPEQEISGLLTPPRTTKQQQHPKDNSVNAIQTALRLLIRHLYGKLSSKDVFPKLNRAEYRELERLIEQRPLLRAHIDQKVRWVEVQNLQQPFDLNSLSW